MDLELELHRVEEDATVLPGRENRRTRGTMFCNKELFVHTLEDEVRRDGIKIPKRSAIPAGRYEIKLTYSGKYRRMMPEIVAVPYFTGIRIHSGHDETHTEGCLLTAGGFDRDGDIIGGTSKPAMEKLEAVVIPALQRRDRVFITITNDFLVTA